MLGTQLPSPSVNKTIASSAGRVKTISQSIDSQLEPVELFDGLSRQLRLSNNMLLESSEIESKAHLKSILMLSAALRIECNGRKLKIDAVSTNGENALAFVGSQLIPSQFVQLCIERESITLEFTRENDFLDEDSRLKAPSPVEILRLIRKIFTPETNSEFAIFLCGVFAFDFIASFEQLPQVTSSDNTCPDFVFYLAETLLVVDHLSGSQRLMANHFSGKSQEKTYFELSRSFQKIESVIDGLISQDMQEDAYDSLDVATEITTDIDSSNYQTTVSKLKQNIIQGDVFQVVPSRTFSLPCTSPIESYRQLKISNPSPYMFYMQDEKFSLFGASPESALKYTSQDNKVLLYPIAGTRPRGKSPTGKIDLDLDARIEAELKLDQKELAEHMMLVDLARNDISRIAKPGTTHVPRLLAVDRYSQVMHLVSCVQGELRDDLDALHAYQACMNMGTLTGAPKLKATELIRQVEGKRRGSYGGAVGYLNGKGDMDTCIVIRSAFFQNGIAYIQAGAGIVFDSDPLMEAQETENKAAAVIGAVQYANNICAIARKESAHVS